MSFREHTRFLWEFFTKPAVVGAIAPSSRGLTRKRVEWIDWPQARNVIEYGPGTGVFTRQILAEMQPGTEFFAIEVSPWFVALRAQNYPQARVHQDSVAQVKTLCEREEMPHVDAILCGLPWAAFSSAEQATYLDAMMTVLRPGGQFVTFAYLQGLLLPAGWRFKQQLHRYFSCVERSSTAWLNLPPAFVYRCRR
jgi:phosphatidylethanolamine/phosphatidyl-N-methylethanolamine N-methyltransferase